MTEEALSIVRDLRNLPLTAAFEGNLGIIAHRQGDYPAARALHEESLALRRQMGDREGVAISLNSLGTIAFFAGDAPSAAAWFEESLAVRRQLGDRRGIGESLNNLAAALRYTGDLDRAEPLADESLAIRRELGDRQGEGRAVYNQAYLRLSRGRIREAMDDFAWALRVASELGDRSQVISTIEGIATACLPERTARAVELWWAADRARRDLDLPHTPLDEGEFVSALSHARGILTAEAYEEAAGKGRDLDLDAAVEAALSLVAPGPQT
jgi:tetratricopeptide (TPR) repeat protein